MAATPSPSSLLWRHQLKREHALLLDRIQALEQQHRSLASPSSPSPSLKCVPESQTALRIDEAHDIANRCLAAIERLEAAHERLRNELSTVQTELRRLSQRVDNVERLHQHRPPQLPFRRLHSLWPFERFDREPSSGSDVVPSLPPGSTPSSSPCLPEVSPASPSEGAACRRRRRRRRQQQRALDTEHEIKVPMIEDSYQSVEDASTSSEPALEYTGHELVVERPLTQTSLVPMNDRNVSLEGEDDCKSQVAEKPTSNYFEPVVFQHRTRSGRDQNRGGCATAIHDKQHETVRGRTEGDKVGGIEDKPETILEPAQPEDEKPLPRKRVDSMVNQLDEYDEIDLDYLESLLASNA